METLTRLVSDSLARHGFDRPIDPRRLQWSRWFRCESTHSLLIVPSRPGIFAIAEEVMDLGADVATDAFVRSTADVGTTAPGSLPRAEPRGPVEQSSAAASTGSAAEVSSRRILAVLQFSEDDDMAFTLDRMFTRLNPMRARLSSGNCFLRFVVIEDQDERRNICSALNQWMLSSAEKAIGIPAALSSLMELSAVDTDAGTGYMGRALLSVSFDNAAGLKRGSRPLGGTNSPPPVASHESGNHKKFQHPPLPCGF